jgi:hypothetical protein
VVVLTPVVDIEVVCATTGNGGIDVWPPSVLTLLLKDGCETTGDCETVWPASVPVLLLKDGCEKAGG